MSKLTTNEQIEGYNVEIHKENVKVFDDEYEEYEGLDTSDITDYKVDPRIKTKQELRDENIILSVRNLKQFFFFGKGLNRTKLKAVNNVSFDVKEGECFGIVGMAAVSMKDGIVKQNVSGNKMVNGILERPVELMPLGQGELPIGELVKNIPDQVNTIIVELDFCNKEMHTALCESYEYMTSNNFAVGNK